MEDRKISFIIVEDDGDFIFLIKQMLKNEPDLELLGCAGNKAEAVRLAREITPDIVLMDLNLSTTMLDGIEASKEIRSTTDAKVIILTSFEDQRTVIEASKKSFASGYVFKSQFELIPDCIRRTAQGHTPQEYLINSLILSELSSAEKTIFDNLLGDHVDISSSPKTIANQKTNIFKKLGVKNQGELMHIFGKMPKTTEIS